MRGIRSYSGILEYPTFDLRYEYVKLSGFTGDSTFGHYRFLNQSLYSSSRWKTLRDKIIIRDNGCDLATPGFEIMGIIIVHHIEPLTLDDIESQTGRCYDPENLVCVSSNTHKALHFNNSELLAKDITIRCFGDTTLW